MYPLIVSFTPIVLYLRCIARTQTPSDETHEHNHYRRPPVNENDFSTRSAKTHHTLPPAGQRYFPGSQSTDVWRHRGCAGDRRLRICRLPLNSCRFFVRTARCCLAELFVCSPSLCDDNFLGPVSTRKGLKTTYYCLLFHLTPFFRLKLPCVPCAWCANCLVTQKFMTTLLSH